MGTTDAGDWIQRSREFSAQEIRQFRKTVAWLPGLARRELAATVCEHLDWHGRGSTTAAVRGSFWSSPWPAIAAVYCALGTCQGGWCRDASSAPKDRRKLKSKGRRRVPAALPILISGGRNTLCESVSHALHPRPIAGFSADSI